MKTSKLKNLQIKWREFSISIFITLGIGLILIASICPAEQSSNRFLAGTAKVEITPPLPFWLTGYAARTNKAYKVRSKLWARALALQDETGKRFVIVTAEILGLPRDVYLNIVSRLGKLHNLKQSEILLNYSHTHCGPVVYPGLSVMFELEDKDLKEVIRYSKTLENSILTAASLALNSLAPAELRFGNTKATFAINRRQFVQGSVRLGENPEGIVDHSVPVITVNSPDGKLQAILFGYACHNTTLGGDFYEVDGDYAGFAQRTIEEEFPGATAMFLQLCGGDQNPKPRGKYADVEKNGAELARSVKNLILSSNLISIQPPIKTVFTETQLSFTNHTRKTYENELQDKNKFKQRRAKLMLKYYDENRPIRSIPYPVQAIKFGNDLILLCLAGEVVLDYSVRAKTEFKNENIIVCGYCNEVSCYIPSLRVLKEGGYEPVDSMIYYGLPGSFADDVEKRIFSTIYKVIGNLVEKKIQ